MDLEEQYDKIYRYCFFRLGCRETAEDITQETFLRFFESASYRDIGQALRYLYTIARNLCIDEYRRVGASPPLEEISDRTEDGAPRGDPPENAVLTRLSVQKSLAELPETDRELLLLRYVNEVPLTVIGDLLGISRFAVYRRLLRAKEQLTDSLRRENIL